MVSQPYKYLYMILKKNTNPFVLLLITDHVGAGRVKSVRPTHKHVAVLCCVQNPDEVFTFLLEEEKKT